MPVASSCRMKRFASGVARVGKQTRTNGVASARGRVTSGIWMRYFSRFMVSGTISGGWSIRRAIFSISWSNAVAIRLRPNGSFANSSAQRTIQGYEAIHMFRKGQIEGIVKGNVLAQNQFINQLFGVAA